ANHGLVLAKDAAENPAVEARVPRGCNTRTQTAIENVVWIFTAGNVPDSGEAHGRVVVRAGCVSRQSCCLALREIVFGHNRLTALVDEHHLLAIQFVWWQLELVTQTISQCEVWLHVPTVTEVHVIRIGNAMRYHRLAKPF